MTLTATERQVVDAVPKGCFIGGRWVDGVDAGFPVDDPATGEVLTEVASASPAEGLAALESAAAAQASWAATAPRERAEVLRRAWELMTARTAELALVMTLEMGKPLAESRAEVAYAAEFFRWFSEEACRVEGSYAVAPNGQGRVLVMRQPVGPCLLITPWNFPLAMGTRKIGPAVAAGCTMLVKPARQTPLSMLALADLLAEAGLPEGVLSVLPTRDSGGLVTPLLADPRLRKLSFTGSTEVGRGLLRQAAEQVLRTSMELGGNAAFVVFEDADLDAAVEGAMVAKMRNIGEACTAANRFLVHDAVAEEFGRRLATRMGALEVGRGTEPGVDVGPLIDEAGRTKVAELVQEAVAGGASVLLEGGVRAGPGFFYDPTVLADVPAGARISQEEIFGPVAAIRRFADDDEAVAAANDTPYGLVDYVYTANLTRALRVCERLETGMIGLNQGMVSNPAAPFGGVKQSGLGREGGRAGIDEYLEVKYVAAALPG